MLKTTAIQADEFQDEHNKLLPHHLAPKPTVEVKEGDILITCAGPLVRCGVSCLVRRTRKRLLMSGKMYRFRVDPNKTDARYVEAFLQTERARLATDKMKTGSSDSGLNLTHEPFRQLRIPVPPLHEQQRIVAEIEKQFTRVGGGGGVAEAGAGRPETLPRQRRAQSRPRRPPRPHPSRTRPRRESRSYEPATTLLARVLEERQLNWKGRGK